MTSKKKNEASKPQTYISLKKKGKKRSLNKIPEGPFRPALSWCLPGPSLVSIWGSVVSSSVVSESETKRRKTLWDETGGEGGNPAKRSWGGGREEEAGNNKRAQVENDFSHLLSSRRFDGSLKRAAKSPPSPSSPPPQSEINGLKLERDMKPAVAYKNACRGGVCKYALDSVLSQLEAQEESICKEEEQNLKSYSNLVIWLELMHAWLFSQKRTTTISK